jgi:hypothetical protein
MYNHAAGQVLTPNAFLLEVREFRDAISNPGLTPEEKRRALVLIVAHASTLNPADRGYEAAGVALKEALCAWLDFDPNAGH